MAFFIDKKEVKKIFTVIVERWAGGTLNEAQRQALDDFMELEIKPLGSLEILDRMTTPGDTLEWFLTFLKTRMPKQYCESVPDANEDVFCFAY